jgi:hypothetical protein
MVKAFGIGNKLLEYMQSNSDRLVTIDELEKSFDTFSRDQIMNNMRNLIQGPAGKNVSQIRTGVWQHSVSKNGTVNENIRVFSVLTVTVNGALIMIDDKGEVYRAMKLE